MSRLFPDNFFESTRKSSNVQLEALRNASSSSHSSKSIISSHHIPIPKQTEASIIPFNIHGQGCVILDTGTESIKTGVAGSDLPQFIVPTIIAKHAKYSQHNLYGYDAFKSQNEISHNHHSSSTSTTGNHHRPYSQQSSRHDFSLCTPMGYQIQAPTTGSSNYTYLNPVEKGVVISLEEMENMYSYIFKNLLRIKSQENGVLLNENISLYHLLESSREVEKYRERMTELFFEKFQIPFLYVGIPQVMSLYSVGKTSGFCVDFGHATTSGLAVVDGVAKFVHEESQHPTHFYLPFGGGEVTEHFIKLLQENSQNQGIKISTSAERACIDDLKKLQCYIATDYPKEITKFDKNEIDTNTTFQLPDGKILNVGREKFVSCEIYFQPTMVALANLNHSPVKRGRSASIKRLALNATSSSNNSLLSNLKGVHELIHDSISQFQSDTNIQEQLIGNIVLSGSSSLFNGMEGRMLRDLKRQLALHKKIQLSQTKVKVSSCSHLFLHEDSNTRASKLLTSTRDYQRGEYSSFIGASILASFQDFLHFDAAAESSASFASSFAMTKQIYQGEGASTIHKFYNVC
ncbi:hypothetical protein C9374_013917 [Naegleria lovaniensis]|uniref:Actin n=1 Tax=Naegleria lovaniensis TaxID=51637 RepID=A0AA88GYD3_NAELO|nr:uncharacterized protein C9374_013917 [Naegleria lovaniensis]KAG2389357.1 hypothetical protein C9374_013917 [Naegleria lovaniensis]